MKIKLNIFLGLVCLLFNCSPDDRSSSNEPKEPSSDLSLTKTISTATPVIGDDVVFSLKVTNSGPNSVSNVSVEDILPSGYTFLSHDGATITAYDNSSGIWSISELGKGSNTTLNITATVNATGNYTNNAQIVSSGNPDPDSKPNNNISNEDDQDSATANPREPTNVQVSTVTTLNAADGLAVDESGNLFASNYGLDRVYKIDTNNNVSAFITNQDGAAGMVFDGQGFMYLARYESADIVKISADGSTIQSYASSVAAPIAINFDSKGNLYTNNNVNNAITRIDMDGNKFPRSIGIFNNSSLTIDESDNIYVSDYDSGRIIKIDANTNEESTFTNLPISGGVGYIIYSNGSFFATAITDQLIFKIDSSGQYEIIAGVQFQAGVQDGNGNIATFNRPIGIVASPDGKTLYVAQNGGSGAIRMITGF